MPYAISNPDYSSRGGSSGMGPEYDIGNSASGTPGQSPNWRGWGGPGGYLLMQEDLALRNQQALKKEELKNKIRSDAAGMANRGQIGAAIGTMNTGLGYLDDQLNAGLADFGPSNAFYKQGMQDGGYSQELFDSILANKYQQINNSARAQALNMSNMASARGMASNPSAAAALTSAGQFAAAGGRGDTRAALEQQRVGNRFQAAAGSAGNAAAMGGMRDSFSKSAMQGYQNIAGLQTQPTQEGALDMLNDRPSYGAGYSIPTAVKKTARGYMG